MKLPNPFSPMVAFVKAIQRDRLMERIRQDLGKGDTLESFHHINSLTHDHGGDPQIPAFVLESLDSLAKLPEVEGKPGATADHATYIAIFYAPKNGEYQERLLERFSRDYDKAEDVTPALLEHYLHALAYAGDKSPARGELLRKIADTAATAQLPSWKKMAEYGHDNIFNAEKVLEILFSAARVGGSQTEEGRHALQKWNERLDTEAAQSKSAAVALAAATVLDYVQDDEIKNTVRDKAYTLFSAAIQDKYHDKAMVHAPQVARLSGRGTEIAATMRQISETLREKRFWDSITALREAAIISHGTDAEDADVAAWSGQVDTLAAQDLLKARMEIEHARRQSGHGNLFDTAGTKLPALADMAAAQGDNTLAIRIAKDAANAGQGTDKWRSLVTTFAKADMAGALGMTFKESESYNQNGRDISLLAAQMHIDLAAELAKTDPAEGLRRLHVIAHDYAGGRDMFGSKHKESPLGKAASQKWAAAVTQLAATDPASALAAARAALKYWDDKAERDFGRIPGSMYKTAQGFVKTLERQVSAPAPTL